MGCVLLNAFQPLVALAEIIVIIQVSAICRNTEETGQLLGAEHFLGRDEHLVQLFTVPCPDTAISDVGAFQL